ncbi:hypothetical protein PM082_002330 [Marasmius tenuissimus]|nr:hypothetical protein PM082_002330 [Marasmius tenuissimus]
MHELLDEYTSRFTSCKTPFIVFVEAMARLYEGRGCREEPECLIWDGVSLGFGRKHIQDSLQPPTHTDSSSPAHNRNYSQKPQAIPQDAKQPIQSLIRRWVTGTQKTRKDDYSDGSSDEIDRGRAVVEDFKVIRRRPTVVSEEVVLLFGRAISLHANIDMALQ